MVGVAADVRGEADANDGSIQGRWYHLTRKTRASLATTRFLWLHTKRSHRNPCRRRRRAALARWTPTSRRLASIRIDRMVGDTYDGGSLRALAGRPVRRARPGPVHGRGFMDCWRFKSRAAPARSACAPRWARRRATSSRSCFAKAPALVVAGLVGGFARHFLLSFRASCGASCTTSARPIPPHTSLGSALVLAIHRHRWPVWMPAAPRRAGRPDDWRFAPSDAPDPRLPSRRHQAANPLSHNCHYDPLRLEACAAVTRSSS